MVLDRRYVGYCSLVALPTRCITHYVIHHNIIVKLSFENLEQALVKDSEVSVATE